MLLAISDLTTEIVTPAGAHRALDRVTLSIARGEALGVVGESGSGKSMLALAAMRLLPPAIRVTGGSIRLDGEDLLALPERRMRSVRGARIGLVFQEPMTALNPLQSIGAQVAELLIVQALEKGLHVAVSSWRRIADDVMPPRVKAGANYQNNRLAAMQARTDGYDDALMLTREGKLAEATGAAVMLVREGELVTPPVTSGVLESLTRKFILTLQQRRGNQPPVQREVDRTELYIADEIFLCGTAEEVTPVVSVDRIAVGDGVPGPITRQFQHWLWEAARGRDPEWRGDLTPVH